MFDALSGTECIRRFDGALPRFAGLLLKAAGLVSLRYHVRDPALAWVMGYFGMALPNRTDGAGRIAAIALALFGLSLLLTFPPIVALF